jgi:hypothetical protein
MTLDDAAESSTTLSEEDALFQTQLLAEVRTLLDGVGKVDFAKGVVGARGHGENVVCGDGHATFFHKSMMEHEGLSIPLPSNQENITSLEEIPDSNGSSSDPTVQSLARRMTHNTPLHVLHSQGPGNVLKGWSRLPQNWTLEELLCLKERLETRMKTHLEEGRVHFKDSMSDGKTRTRRYWETATHLHPLKDLAHNAISSVSTARDDHKRYKMWLDQEKEKARAQGEKSPWVILKTLFSNLHTCFCFMVCS